MGPPVRDWHRMGVMIVIEVEVAPHEIPDHQRRLLGNEVFQFEALFLHPVSGHNFSVR